MDPEARMRKQSRRVIISEVIMVISVVLMVAILALLVSGYWLNSDFTVERQGMLQISSFPTGANVEVDGDAPWYQRTNTSKVLSSGEHSIKLVKDGYDTWSKTINVSEGLLYRLHYPRLFLNNRTKSDVYDLSGVIYATVSPNREKMLLAYGTTSWRLISLENETITAKTIDVSRLFSTADSSVFTDTIISADWDGSSEHILFATKSGDATKWVLLDTNTVANSVNLTDIFSTGYTRVDILDNSANNLLAVQGQSLYRIDVGAKRISEPLLQNVIDYDHLGSEIAYVISKTVTPAEQIADPATSGVADESISPTTTTAYEIGTLRIGSDEPKVLSLSSKPARILISRFYDEKYLTVVSESDVTVYYENDFSEMLSRQLSFVPNVVKVGHNGEFCTFISDEKIATLDMEAQDIREWNLDSVHFGWLDDDMIYAVAGGVLSVYDYDGLNRRTLAQNVSAKYPATIASNNKWLYYVSDNTLVREIVAD
ncbi:PEGA domain-containing protein [Candidatus Saccharibacteria bacterium]|nr:PEGA domain-containing protein [Candidatus Saccharibacteria bacterium]